MPAPSGTTLLQPFIQSKALPGLGGSFSLSEGTKASGRGWGQMHPLLHGSLGGSVPPSSWVLPQFCGYPRMMLKLWAPGEARQDVLGHELIQKKALKIIKLEKKSQPRQLLTAHLLYFVL